MPHRNDMETLEVARSSQRYQHEKKKRADTSKGYHMPFDHAKTPVTGREPTAVPLLDYCAT